MDVMELLLTAKLLRLAADEQANRTCDDVDESMIAGFTEDQKLQLCHEFYLWNRDPETIREFEQGDLKTRLRLFTWIRTGSWMAFMAHKLEKMTKPDV